MMFLPLFAILAATVLAGADAALDKRDFDEAIRQYRLCLQEDPASVDAWIGLGKAFDGQHKLDEALAAYAKAVELAPGNPFPRIGRARALARAKRYSEALEDLNQVASAHPDNPHGWWALGDVHLWAGHAEEAVAAYSRAVELLPESPGPKIGRGRAYAKGKHYGEAVRDLQEVLSKNPKVADAWWALGDARLWSGSPHEAMEAYTQCLAIAPDSTGPRISRARAYARGRRFQEAVQDIQYVTEHYPRDDEAWWALGDIQLWAGHPKEAAEAYTRSLEIVPENPDPRIGRARALAQDDHFPEARKDLEQVLEHYPRYADGWCALGDVRLWAGESDAAVEAYTKALEIAPKEPGLRIARGRAHARGRQYPEAIKDFEQVLAEYPEDADAWSALGDTRLWMGEPGKAEEAYSKVVALRPEEPEGFISRARARHAASRVSDALDDLGRAEALAWDPTEIKRLKADLGTPPQGAMPWQVSVQYSSMDFSHDRENWRSTTERIQRNWTRGSLALETMQTYRFGLNDEAYTLDGYAPLWERAYVNLRYQGVENPNVLPKADYLIQPFQGFGKGWEGSVFYRHMDFPTAQVDLYGGSLSRQVGQWFVMDQVTLVPGLGSIEASDSLLVRRYFGASDSYVQAQAGAGSTRTTVAAGDVERHQSSFFSTTLSLALSQHWEGLVSLNYQDEETTPVGRGITVGLALRW